ncbi:MAG: YlmC/YmxH family sporulation protein [Oscillospiraceae bacterium]|nr:YlmC/YmxH family sporulation protein [Oscillospiraceae bacterium]
MVALSILCRKDIISISTGRNIGRADDLEFDENTSSVQNLIVFGRPKFFGILGRRKDIRIPWSDVITVGTDVILIKTQANDDVAGRGVFTVDYD